MKNKYWAIIIKKIFKKKQKEINKTDLKEILEEKQKKKGIYKDN